MQTFQALMRCPDCQNHITQLREDPRGDEVPYCCGFFWRPKWSIENWEIADEGDEDGRGDVCVLHLVALNPQSTQTVDVSTQTAQNSVDNSAESSPVNPPAHQPVNPPQKSVNPRQKSVNPRQNSVNPRQNSAAPQSTETADAESSAHNSQQNSEPAALSAETTAHPILGQPDATQLNATDRIKEFLIHVNAEHTASTGEIRAALEMSPSTFKFAMDPLLAAGEVEKIGYGLWKLQHNSGA